MNRSRSSALALAFLVSTTTGVAQGPRPMPLKPGDPFPRLDIYDAAGNSFNTKGFEGQYTVIVNGCLT